MTKHKTYDKASMSGHAVFIYSNRKARLNLIVEYFRQGLANDELCVYVTPEPQETVINEFKEAGLDVSEQVQNRSFRIFDMAQTYLHNHKFASNFMLQNVRNFLEAAKLEGYEGLRTAGEMSWLNDHPTYVEEAKSYELKVNSLNNPTPNFAGLCLYPMEETASDALDAAMHTHPTVIYDEQVYQNKSYTPQ